jgi:putative membrane protein|tara:strand:+ start:1160 stop:1594 length:435 start_codon:yes stop_codon:yes gene_type:complete
MNYYLLFKSLHLIVVISWMVGLLYLPRIFVYHAENNTEKNISDIFKTMEKRLMFFIMTPAMILSWLLGIILILINETSINSNLWIQAKLFLVVLLTIYHLFLGYYLRKFALDKNEKSTKFFRIINEIPTILLILIIFVIIYKPL